MASAYGEGKGFAASAAQMLMVNCCKAFTFAGGARLAKAASSF
jgi:hypothetical protein